MGIEEIKDYIIENFERVHIMESGNDLFFMHDKDAKMPFATIVASDNEYDHVSHLDRDGFYRLNVGIDKKQFETLFENIPKKKGIGAYLDSDMDFTKEDKILPHPVYGSMYWVCVVNPSKETFESLKEYLTISYSKVSK